MVDGKFSRDRRTRAVTGEGWWGSRRGIFCESVRIEWMGVRLHRLGRHDCGCVVVVWVDVVGEGGDAVVGRVGGVWWKSRGVCRDGKCWEGHGVGEWQRILVGTLLSLEAAFRKQLEGATRRTTYQIRATMNGARGSASSKGNPPMMMELMVLDSVTVLAMLDDVDGIVYNPHPPYESPQSF